MIKSYKKAFMLLTNSLCMWALCSSNILDASLLQFSQLSGSAYDTNTEPVPTMTMRQYHFYLEFCQIQTHESVHKTVIT